MITLIRTDSENKDFTALVKKLDADLAEKDGSEHSFYAQFNTINKIRFVIVVYENNEPIACGAIKEFQPGTMEVKRMYVLPEQRGKGIAALILTELEKWSVELSCNTCVLETGKRQQDAIRLYLKNGYSQTENYGQYIGVDNSLCFAKQLNQTLAYDGRSTRL